MTISTITINTIDYIAYASVAEADAYLAVDPVRMATWAALSANDKGVNLVSGTRRLDFLEWMGTKTGGDGQENDWPRTGLTYEESGNPVSTTEVPKEVENATILLAGSIAITASVSQSESSGSNTKRVKAGSAEVEFFRLQAGKPLQDESAFDLVQQWTEGAGVSAATGPLASGVDGESSFCDPDQFGLDRGYS